LRNGTIGWILAGQQLDKGQSRTFADVSDTTTHSAAERARGVADRAGVKRAHFADVQGWRAQRERTTYFFDTRTPQEFAAGHLEGFRSTPGGQLVQETEMVAPVRGARIVLIDNDGVRANMTASWLAQMACLGRSVARIACCTFHHFECVRRRLARLGHTRAGAS
jgi:rhodanese-related sulfurtransferase